MTFSTGFSENSRFSEMPPENRPKSELSMITDNVRKFCNHPLKYA